MFPSSETRDAPLASRANLGPVSCFAVSFTAPRILAAALVGLEIETLIPCVGQIWSCVRK